MVILERSFHAKGETVTLRVEKPKPDGADFRCEYAIEGGGLERRSYGMGVDSIQALLLALSRAHLDLLCARRDGGLSLMWLDMRDLGLPLPDNSKASDFD